MAWTAPMTAVENAVWSSSQFNTYVRDNLLETAPAKATAAGQFFFGSGANAIVARSLQSAGVDSPSGETTTLGTYTDLATPGPAVTVTTGTRALVWFKARFSHASANVSSRCSVEVSGATTIAASHDWCLLNDGRPANGAISVGTAHMFTGLTPGSNTFTMKYNATNGKFYNRYISVLPIG